MTTKTAAQGRTTMPTTTTTTTTTTMTGLTSTADAAARPASKPAPDEAASPHAVTLFTDRAVFEQRWSRALVAAGLAPNAAHPDQLPETLKRGAVVVIDAGADPYDEDELLAHVGLARALGAKPVVAASAEVDVSSIDDILDDLCVGMVARRPEDIDRIVASLSRRADASRARRFEFLTVSPRGGELLAIFSDGNAALVDRTLLDDDDGSPIEAITLEQDATSAVLSLESGQELALTTATVARKSLLGRQPPGASGIDGVRLGKRIRELRLTAGLTQAELARRTGIHRPNIARVEAGRHTPSLATLSRLASAIGVPTTAVLDD